jgi:hypothetical protein
VIVVLASGIGLYVRETTPTGGGGPPREGDLVMIPTLPPAVPDGAGNIACHLALLEGRLVAHPRWGLAAEAGTGPLPVLWPHGWVGRISGDGMELLDHRGRPVARTGDRFDAGGGTATVDGLEGFGVCPAEIRVVVGE